MKKAKRSFQQFIERLNANRLLAEVEYRARLQYVSLIELYEGPRVSSIMTARRDVFTWLSKKKGKGVNEIARLFDRAPSGVCKLIGTPSSASRKKRRKARAA